MGAKRDILKAATSCLLKVSGELHGCMGAATPPRAHTCSFFSSDWPQNERSSALIAVRPHERRLVVRVLSSSPEPVLTLTNTLLSEWQKRCRHYWRWEQKTIRGEDPATATTSTTRQWSSSFLHKRVKKKPCQLTSKAATCPDNIIEMVNNQKPFVVY